MVTAASVYSSINVQNYILILNEALHVTNRNHSLLRTSQPRHYHSTVQDTTYDTVPTCYQSLYGEFFVCIKSKGATIFLSHRHLRYRIRPHARNYFVEGSHKVMSNDDIVDADASFTPDSHDQCINS